MARITHERENLLRDARALVPRVQLSVPTPAGATAVFAGFRGEALSLYFGDDPAFHFNARGELRRAYAGDQLIKAEGGRLIAMRRERTGAEVQLQSTPLSDGEQRELLADLAERLAALRTSLDASLCRVDGQEPVGGDAVARLAAWLAINTHPEASASPRIA